MTNRIVVQGVTVLLLLAVPFAVEGDPLQGLELVAEQQGADPLPYQAVRVRMRLKNSDAKEATDLRRLESFCFLTGYKGPHDTAFHSLRERPGGVVRLDKGISILNKLDVRLRSAGAYQAFTLNPGQEMSVAVPLSSYETEDNLFLQPGSYVLQLIFRAGQAKDAVVAAKPITVTVRKPAGDDAEVFQILHKNPKLLSLFLGGRQGDRPNAIAFASPKYAQLLEAIVENYPKSSYAYYARALLVRFQLKTELDNQGGFREPTAPEIAKATALLEGVTVKDFSLAPEVLVFLKKYSKDPAKIKKIEETLQAEYYDSIERIYDLVWTVPWDKIEQMRKAPAGLPKP